MTGKAVFLFKVAFVAVLGSFGAVILATLSEQPAGPTPLTAWAIAVSALTLLIAVLAAINCVKLIFDQKEGERE